MKKKIYKICGVALALVLVFSLLGAFAPAKQVEAEAYTANRWNTLSTPSGSGCILVEGSNVTDFAVGPDGATVYLVDVQTADGWAVAKSTNGGASFSWLFGTGYAAAVGAPTPPTGFEAAPTAVAVSPDDPNAVALVEGVGVGADKVWISNNGGATWASLGVPGRGAGELISDIAVSQTRIGTILGRDYAVSTYDTTTLDERTGDVYVIGTTADWGGVATAAGLDLDFTSLALAPNWTGDRVVLAVGSDAADGGNPELTVATATGDSFLVAINVATIPAMLVGPKKVRLDAAGSDSPAEVGATGEDGGQIVSSSIALPSDFDSTSVGNFRAYVGWSSVPTTTEVILCADDAYRVDFMSVRKLEVRPTVGIYSVSYFGTVAGGTLMVGESASTGVWFSSDPMVAMPTWQFSFKKPTGEENCIVALISETEALGGGSGDDSALSKTEDGGLSFNGLSFIDEDIDAMNDVMASPDGSVLFLATDDGTNHSLWRGVGFPDPGKWQRVGFTTFVGAGSFVRLSPDYLSDTTVYWFDKDGKIILRSTNAGQIWGTRTPPEAVTDATIESQDILYVISGAKVYSSTNGGWFFGLPTDAGLGSLATIAMAPSYPQTPVVGNILVGGAVGGRVGLSTNAAASFRPLLSFTATGSMQVLADADYATNDIVYAASSIAGEGIYRYEVGTSTAWEQINPVAGAMTGLAYGGTLLYGSWSSAAGEAGAEAVAEDAFAIVNTHSSLPQGGYLMVSVGKVKLTPFGCTIAGGLTELTAAGGTVTLTFDAGGYLVVKALEADSRGVWGPELTSPPYGYHLDASITVDANGNATVGGWAEGGSTFSLPDAAVAAGEEGEGASGVERALYPTAPAPLWTWGTMDKGATAATFTAAPSALRASGTGTENVLWAINVAEPKLMAYVDTMATVVPTVSVPSEVACDSATGRNASFTITWNQISNATAYKVDICLDKGCTQRANRFSPAAIANPAAPELYVPAGAAYLSAGKTYYVKVAAIDQVPGDAIESYGSKVVTFSIAPGVPVKAPYLGPQILGPAPGATDVPLSPGFTWAPYAGSTKYEFKLANDAALSDIVAEAKVATTAYSYEGTLANNTTYFWAVRGIEPVASDWSPVGTFTTIGKPVPPVVVEPTPPAEIPPSAITPGVIWAIIAIGAILVIAVIVLIVRTRRIA